MEQILHHGRKTAFRMTKTEASDPTICYVHGSGGTHRVWNQQYGSTGPVHPSVSIDLSGHGESEDVRTQPGPSTLDAYAEDVTAVARETDADVLVGNSLGGAVVLHVVLEERYDPAGLVLVGSGAKLAVHPAVRRMAATDFRGLVRFLHEDSRLLATDEEDVLDQSRDAMIATGQRVTERDFLTCHEFDVRDELAAIEQPTLAVVGEQDPLTPPEYHEYLVDEVPDCRMATIENASHLAMVDQPTAFNTIIESFCNELY